MNVGTRLKGPIQARNEGYLFLELLERFHGGGQFKRMLPLDQVGLGFVGREIVSIEKRSDPILLARKESSPDNPDGHVIKGQALSNGLARSGSGGQAFHPWQGEHRATDSTKKVSSRK